MQKEKVNLVVLSILNVFGSTLTRKVLPAKLLEFHLCLKKFLYIHPYHYIYNEEQNI